MPVGCFPRDRANCTAPCLEFESSSREREQAGIPHSPYTDFPGVWQDGKRDVPPSPEASLRTGGRFLFFAREGRARRDDPAGAVRERRPQAERICPTYAAPNGARRGRISCDPGFRPSGNGPHGMRPLQTNCLSPAFSTAPSRGEWLFAAPPATGRVVCGPCKQIVSLRLFQRPPQGGSGCMPRAWRDSPPGPKLRANPNKGLTNPKKLPHYPKSQAMRESGDPSPADHHPPLIRGAGESGRGAALRRIARRRPGKAKTRKTPGARGRHHEAEDSNP